MHASFDIVVPAQFPDRLPIRLEQSTSRAGTALRLLLLAPALAVLAVPLTLVAAHAVATPAAWSLLTARPLTSVQVALAVVIWTVLFVWPLQRLLMRAGARRLVHLTADMVSVEERSLFGRRVWSTPLAGYRGLAHHVRSSLSGVQHEVILVHPDPSRHVLLTVSDGVSAATMARIGTLLGLPEVPARDLYVSQHRWHMGTSPAVAPRLASAQA